MELRRLRGRHGLGQGRRKRVQLRAVRGPGDGLVVLRLAVFPSELNENERKIFSKTTMSGC